MFPATHKESFIFYLIKSNFFSLNFYFTYHKIGFISFTARKKIWLLSPLSWKFCKILLIFIYAPIMETVFWVRVLSLYIWWTRSFFSHLMHFSWKVIYEKTACIMKPNLVPFWNPNNCIVGIFDTKAFGSLSTKYKLIKNNFFSFIVFF